MKRKKLLAGMLAAVSVTMTSAIAACTTEPADEPQTEGPETGVYYFDAGTDEYTLALGNVDEFTFLVNGVTKKGTYTLSDGTLYLDFAQAEDEDITATLEDDVITLTYQDASMRFLKRIDYTVTYDTQGRGSVEADTVINGKTVSAPEVPAYDGYTFVGWYTDTTYMTPFLFDAQPVTGDMTLYAYWLKTSQEKTEYTVDFDLGYEAGLPAVETVEGCVIASQLPVPVRDGYTFLGWYASAFDSADKLTYQYMAGTPLREDTTLFALWRSDAEEGLAVPEVSVTSSGVSWEAVSGAKVYDVTITAPNGLTQAFRNLQTTSQSYDFSAEDAGEYVVTVTASAANSAEGDANAVTATRYFNNKALAAVSSFTVVKPSALVFEGVEHAQSYYLTIECGNPAHRHEDVALGSSTNYNFSNCAMQEGGIRFTVRAEADGYAPSVSKTFVYNRALAQVTGLTYDAATETIRWDAVADAMSYVIAVGNTVKDIGSATSYCIKDCAAGEVTFTVYPRTKGYNSPVPSELKVTKATLATPQALTVRGNTLTWNAVEGATSYTVRINGTEYAADTNSFDLSQYESAGELSVMVRADGANNSLWSDAKSLRYLAMSGALVYAANTLTWNPVIGATYYEVQVNEGEIIRISDVGTTSAAIALTQAGWNTLRVRFGGEEGLPSEWAETRVFAYEIAFDTRGGTAVESVFAAYGDAVTLPVPASDAYDFEGWYNIPSGTVNNGALYEDAVFEERNDILLYASWHGKSFEVTYDAQGGSVQEPSAQVEYDAPFVLAVPEAGEDVADRIFIGWYSAENGNGTRYTDEKGVSLTDWNVAENTTLYAYWAEVLLYVETIGSGGEEGYSVQAGPGIGYVTSVTVPATYAGKPVTDIFSGAFRGCEELEEINLPNSLQTVGSVSSGESTGAFAGCTALRAINVYEVEGSHEVRYFSEDGVLLENSPQTGNVTIAYFPMARTGDYVVPDGVQEISAYTFTRAAISSVTIPDSVLFVRQRAFYYCLDLAEVNFAAGGTDGLLLEQYAFQGSVSLEEITLPARMTSVELASALFDGCDALENIYVEAGSANYVSVDGLLCDETGATLLYYPSGRTGAFTVPVTITAIGDGAFAGHKGLTQVTIGAYVQSVGEGAFKGCVGLTSVEFASAAIPQEMTIGEGAFRDCAYLERVTFGENSNVTSIGGYAFSGCRRLEAFTIPETVTEIGTYAFENCATLEEITLTGQSVTVGNYAFSGCESLDSVSIGTSVESFNFILVFNDCAAITTVNVDPNNAFFATYDDVLYNKDLTTLIFCPRGRTEVSIADSTLVIGDNAFESSQITNVTLPDGVTTIGSYAFSSSQLAQINIPASVATISDRAFYFCQHLQKVDFEERHDQPLKLGTYLFNSCSELESLGLPEGLLTIGSSAFSNCKSLTELELPASVVTVSAGAFTGCAALSLTVDQANTHLTVQNGVLYENRSSALVFFGSATEVEIPEGVTTLASSLFANSAVTKVILPSSVTTLPASLFDGCTALKEVVINGRITSIGSYAFRNTAITSFTIGNSVTSVGSYAFSGCAALTSLVFEAGGTSALTIGTYAFQNCTALTDLNLTLRVRDSGRVYGLGVGCFQGCTALENISFGVMYGMGFDTGAMLTLGSNSFRYCESLSSILIPDYVSSIASYVFQGCTALSEVILSDPLYETEDYFSSARGVFADCTSLESLTIPVNIIGWSDFGLFEGSCLVTSIQVAAENEAFCSIDGNLYSKDGTVLVQYAPGKTETSFVVPDGVTEIFGGAFVGCGSLMNVTVPASVQTISWFAFNGWTKDRTITVFFYDRRTACGKQGDIGNHAEPPAEPPAEPHAGTSCWNLMPTLSRPRAENPICACSGQSGSERTIRFKAENLFRTKIKMPLDKAKKIKYNLFRKSINLP